MGFSSIIKPKGATGVSGSNGEDADLVFITSASASSSASLIFDNVFTDEYETYFIRFFNFVPATNGVSLGFVFRKPSLEDVAGTYYYGFINCQIGAAASGTLGGTAAYALIVDTISNSALYNTNGSLFISPRSNHIKRWNIETCRRHTGGDYIDQRGGVLICDWSVAGIKFNFTSGNISTGTVQIYGVKKV